MGHLGCRKVRSLFLPQCGLPLYLQAARGRMHCSTSMKMCASPGWFKRVACTWVLQAQTDRHDSHSHPCTACPHTVWHTQCLTSTALTPCTYLHRVSSSIRSATNWYLKGNPGPSRDLNQVD